MRGLVAPGLAPRELATLAPRSAVRSGAKECGDDAERDRDNVLMPSGVDDLLGSLAKHVFQDPNDLGSLARSLRDDSPTMTRQRDLFPLPLSSCKSEFSKAVVVVLNFLYGVRAPVRFPQRLSLAQQSALLNVECCVEEFVARLGVCPSCDKADASWSAFEPKVDGRLELIASQVDCPEEAGACDPMMFLPDDVRARLLDPEILFKDAPPGLDKFPGFYAGDRAQYVGLVVRQLRCGKVGLLESVKGGGTVFPVGKSSGKQREVWHGSRVSAAAVAPPRPAHLASPSAFRSFELVGDEVLRLSKRDGRCFFDQLCLPDCLRPYMGRPAVHVGELLAAGLSVAELQSLLPSDALAPTRRVWPVSLVWGMGFSWSSFVAQSTLLAVCEHAGLGTDCVLSPDGPAPASFERVFSLATDDVMLFSVGGPGVTTVMAKQLEDAFDVHRIVKHKDKDVDDALNGECVGVELVDGRWWWPPASRMWTLLSAVAELLEDPHASPAGVRAFLGTLQWYDLLERSKLSVYDDVYGFAASSPEAEQRCVPRTCLTELLCGVVLGPFWGFDMRTPHQPLIVASDASTSFGLGVSVTELPLERVRALSRLDVRTGDHVVLGCAVEGDKDRLGTPHSLDLEFSDFTTVLSVKAEKEHINIMEGKAFLLALRWVLRRPQLHKRRLVVLIDSKVWIGAAAKGRSSSPSLLRLLRRVAALVLGTGLVVHYLFIPSAHNPADAPSRGLQATKPRDGARGLAARSRRQRRDDAAAHAQRAQRLGVCVAHDLAVEELSQELARCGATILRLAARDDLAASGRVSLRCMRRLLARLAQQTGSPGRLDSILVAAGAVHGRMVDYRALVSFLQSRAKLAALALRRSHERGADFLHSASTGCSSGSLSSRSSSSSSSSSSTSSFHSAA